MVLSVVVPTYKRPGSLRCCLQSLMAGRRVPDEVVVVIRDTDATSANIAAQFQAHLPRGIRLVRTVVERPGLVAALNAGLASASGEVVCFLDDDMVVSAEWLGKIEAHFRDPGVGGAGGRDVVYRDGMPITVPAVTRVGCVDWLGRIIGNHHCDPLFSEPVYVRHLKGCNMTFRRSLLPGFDEALAPPGTHSDTDASLSVGASGAKLVYDPTSIGHHVVAERSEPGGRDSQSAYNVFGHSHNGMYCLLKHFPPVRWPLFFLFSFLIGEGEDIGLWKLLRRLLGGDGSALKQYLVACRGKIVGIWSYGAGWRTRRQRGSHGNAGAPARPGPKHAGQTPRKRNA